VATPNLKDMSMTQVLRNGLATLGVRWLRVFRNSLIALDMAWLSSVGSLKLHVSFAKWSLLKGSFAKETCNLKLHVFFAE